MSDSLALREAGLCTRNASWRPRSRVLLASMVSHTRTTRAFEMGGMERGYRLRTPT